ncbi:MULTISPECIES: trifunctional transcriptional regulator/proline dehydrogenase/L-glutamate gamma-semialdehyde dehydrogenase [unclassified Variovorax]|uniref:trifunctional transcriptional regulator/proline dehydrogenase/L-glutamate gamma-semialdehyde dehydrogenase n=1 Tax=unclassified Variovorax TaxID=663243 RepID=UPI0008C062AE|nr:MULTISPECIES: trifunctional transcriptional regulator/proline dehydrogenase/L-glutamate gamma-semialdehyde dehydrogenase [unclassified Variovorax]SEJ01883.1 L-proline dehydrogenase /delta-1-pyrroline-5-carboxylate dehydrogenase [Variovorax sp. OK202]SFB91623.1 L-proline dehydrogenase /delta-1-pyrroline-5-carboxylate dehydrogenase [Variovorax sp. OK212]
MNPTSDAPLPSSFAHFADGLAAPSALRAAITAACRRPEPQALAPLLAQARLPDGQAQAAHELAHRIAQQLRNRKNASGRAGLVQGLLQEYALSSQEGVALMCLAEALLRIPDAETRNALIRDKIAHGQWQSHAGRSPSVFVNAATWGLLLTGKLVATHSETGLSAVLTRLIGKGGEPLIRKGVDMAMRMMGEQFVTGETIAQALGNARELEAQGFRYSYDMLGEAALTAADAKRYRVAYEEAIHAIGKASAGRGVYEGPGISIKLSALHPRYSRAQHARVMAELYPVLRELTLLAQQYDIGLNIDAEEADRLELSLDLLERLCFEPALAGWNGIGFVIQAYQKRCPFVIDFVVDLARRSRHRLMVRLVKGAYWDSEIKRAQVDGLDGYPVYTRKAYTDVSYLACARRLLDAPEQVYPQFATHNAHTLAAIYTMADPSRHAPGQYEFQCLHGMGEPLYEQVVGPLGRPCRIYAPVGTHETLLAYLVRRLLENGANTSFVNRIADPTIPLEVLVEDPVATVERMGAQEGKGTLGLPHPAIALPAALYGAQRTNSHGLDLANDDSLRALGNALHESAHADWRASPLLAQAGDGNANSNPWADVRNPADLRDIVGRVQEATPADVESAIAHAQGAAAEWAATPPAGRADLLERAGDLLEARMPQLLGLLAREAGKTYPNAIAEVREAVDFLRFYAAQARDDFSNDTHRALGPMVCISPWNFPLAIFTGQVAAALAAGNPVLAKPAEQTPLVAAEAVRALWEAGVPRAAVQLLPGRGETVGAALVADARVQGVMFTGSTEVARLLQKTLSRRLGAGGAPVPLIAETGGQNAMIVDSSALVEQVVIDVMSSAFDSAGQRCSALRVLCVQEEAADRLVEMLKGAMAEACIGNPARLAVDVGPVIDAEARDGIERHIAAMRAKGRKVFRQGREYAHDTREGTYVMPTLIELDGIAELQREVFGPVLHLVRYRRRDLGALVGQINSTGYGLTLGVHTRIDETIAQVVAHAKAGNVYVNRNIVGAVVGVQPFGGEGLSGTGPKAGGPLYMLRMLSKRPDDAMARAVANDAAAPRSALSALSRWAASNGRAALAAQCTRFAAQSRAGSSRTLAGPTGERNVYTLVPRDAVLCLAGDEADRLTQLAAVLSVGSTAIWPADAAAQALRASLPAEVQPCVAVANDWASDTVVFDAALHHGDASALANVMQRLAARPGPIVGVRAFAPGDAAIPLESLVVERALSINTAAAGGNASLMTIG